MDPVQLLLGTDDNGATSSSTSLPPKRYKVVYVYSDEDDDDDNDTKKKTIGPMLVSTDHLTIPVDDTDLADLRAEAVAEASPPQAEDGTLLFQEDILGGTDVLPSPPLMSGGMRVKLVEATPLFGGESRKRIGLRDHLSLEELPTKLRRTRFREDGEEEVIEEELQPVLDAAGAVRAVTVGEYCLTVDERDLQDDCEPPADGDGDQEEADWDEDEEDEEDEELDDAIVVAVVEQLVRSCEAEDLDPAIAPEATRFLTATKPPLQRLLSEEISPKEFGEIVYGDLRRFQRIFRAVYRPKDEPIIIDGVIQDL